jgi:ABC-type transport system substrate-binding protein
MNAIYDTIVRYNTTTGKYDNNTAESVTANADSTEWTVKLKSGIKFTDGTAYDAEAVKFGMNRHRSGTAGAPPCAETVRLPPQQHLVGAYMGLVKSIDVVDALTSSHAQRIVAELPLRAVGRSRDDPVTDGDQEVSPRRGRGTGFG